MGYAVRRRDVLALTGVGVAAAISACAADSSSAGDASTAQPSTALTPSGSPLPVTVDQLATTHLPGGTTPWAYVLPSRKPPTGLVLLLHGAGHTGPQAFQELGIGQVADATGLALAAVSGANTWWHPRGAAGDGLALVIDDLLPAALDVSGLPASTKVGLLGYSMGGYGALLVGSELGPERTRAIVAQAPALFPEARDATHAFDSADEFATWSITGERIETLRQIPVWIDCGEQDVFIDVSRQLADDLPHAKATFRPGGHDTKVWRPLVGDELAWIEAQPA